MTELNRRHFLAGTAAATVALATNRSSRAAASPNEKVVFAIMGANNRGSQLATTLTKIPNAEIAYICDCEESALAKGISAASSNGRPAPKGIKDFRQALDDKHVDALICSAPNHWHAAATLTGLAAGKHVYCEKPASHTPDEGERMIEAAKKSDRVLQIGLQRRSHPQYRDIIEKVRSGAIGKVLYAKSTYYNNRPSIGRGKQTAPPASLDYDLWQGPVTAQPYRDNLIPYNWHLFWHYGNSEVGNNGVHTIDICRWALGVDYPTRVVATGGKFRYDDDEETPDTCNIVADFEGGRTLVWEGVSWSPPYKPLSGINIELRGDAGAMFFEDYYYRRFDADRKLVEEMKKGNNSWQPHMENFIAAIRSGAKLNCGIEDGHKSTMLAHLGNIAYRTGRSLDVDPTNGHIKNSPAADKLWACEYRKGWFPGV
ncbi:MAG TPA: Gfo/Idh/MocA family oxidoreductase [Pirellulaceae bacterium]